MATHRETTAAEVLGESRALPAWMGAIRQQRAADIARALSAKSRTLYQCPKCLALTMAVEGPRWRCEADGCGRGGDTLELVSRGLHGTVYFQLDERQRRGVWRWCSDYLRSAEL